MTMKRKSWQDYQKEIADDHYYYARSCIRQNFFPGSEKLFIDMLRNDLGKDLSDDPTVCGERSISFATTHIFGMIFSATMW